MSVEQEVVDSRLAIPLAASNLEEPGTGTAAASAMGDILAKEEEEEKQQQNLSNGQTLPEMTDLEKDELQIGLHSHDSIANNKKFIKNASECSIDIDYAHQMMSIIKNYKSIDNDNDGGSTIAIADDAIYAQCREQCLASSSSTTTSDVCDCKECKWKKRNLSKEDFGEMIKFKQLGVNLRRHIRSTFHWFMETSGFSANSTTTLPHQPPDSDSIENFVDLRKSVVLLCEKVPYQLFMWLVGQAQEFVIGVKVQLLTLLYDRSVDNLAEVFITKLLDGYEALLATAVHISDLLEPLQNELFSKVNLTWGYINKSLYQNYVFSDPLIQNNLPSFLGQLKDYTKEEHSKCKYLLDRYFTFNDEITKIGSLCPEIERLIDRYNAEQVTGSVMKKVREDFERFKTRLKLDLPIYTDEKLEFIKEVDDSNCNVTPDKDDLLYTNSYIQACSLPHAVEIQGMFNDWKKSPQQRLADLVEALTLSSSLEEETKSKTIKEKKCSPSCTEKTVVEGINESVSCEKQDCECDLDSSLVDSSLNPKQENSQNIPNNILSHNTASIENRKDNLAKPAVRNNESNDCPPLSHPVISKMSKDSCKEPLKKVAKTTVAQTAQAQIRHSTTQTLTTNHNQNHVHQHYHQGRCSSHSHLHGSLSNSVIKSSGLHRTHVGHNIHPPGSTVTCHKQQHIVEHIKRLSAIDLSPGENGDCSDSGSSHEDTCSATNSPTPRDSSRHCDCCYCEVFGHGVPSVAPVSRNYNEMRERLRQLLSKKKAKVCKPTAITITRNSIEVSLSSSSLSSTSSTSSTITNVDSTNLPNPASRSNTPISTTLNAAPKVTTKIVNSVNAAAPAALIIKPKEYSWSIDAAVEFIEGNNSKKKNEKKAAKKARQKQKKLDEKLQQKKIEEDRLKLIELQKKTPEVTITVVNPQKQQSQRSAQQTKLPEVSIIPAILSKSQSAYTVSKQTNVGTKKNTDFIGNNNKNAMKGKTATVPVVPLTAESVKKKTANTVNVNQAPAVNQTKSKTPGNVNEIVPYTNNSDLSNLTKKERKKLRRAIKKQEELKQVSENSQSENQLQIVTIKRIMESNSVEPTVTITLKGQTPAEDKVLFTLVNGQSKDSSNEKSTQSQTTGKKKKNKTNNSVNQAQQQGNHVNKSRQLQISNNGSKTDASHKNNSKNTKQQQQQQQQQQLQQQTNKDKSKTSKQQEEQKTQQQQSANINETKSTKSKKNKQKNNEDKENILKQTANENLQKQKSSSTNKKSNKTPTSTAQTQSVGAQKQQQQQHPQQQQQQPQQSIVNSNNKNTKNVKNQNQIQNQNQNQNHNQKKVNNNCSNQNNNSSKLSKNNNVNNGGNQNHGQAKIDNQKTSKVAQNTLNKQKQSTEPVQSQRREQTEPFPTNYHRGTNNTLTSIDIENLKLPPGITITKVDAPVKPLPLKTNTVPKPVNNTPKQTTIIAAPMSGVQPSNYGSPQGSGNVIVVDTSRLKQELIPKNEAAKDANSQSSSSKKKKKKKNKNSAVNGNDKTGSVQLGQNNGRINHHQLQQQQQQLHSNDYIEPARILHNPTTNMVTIRNPAFGPAPPKMEPCVQQAAIIKVGENGIVTIRSPALQQAINAGLQPPPKPDFIVKGGASKESKLVNNSGMSHNELLSGQVKGPNGMHIPTDLQGLRRRLAQQPDNDRTTSTTLFNNGLSSIQISKVTNGQSPIIPENGITLKGTSVTLTKIRNPEIPGNHSQQQLQQQQQHHVDESKGNSLSGNASKSRKKKKKGNGGRQGGDDWNLVESVFTPKDIDLEDGEMDETERELEAFKRFCLQSVPPQRKEKVNLNLKDIVLKKKSSASGSPGAATASAPTTSAAAVVAAI